MMSIDLKDVKAPAVITVLLFLIAVMGSGVLFIFIYYQQLFYDLDTVKLLLIAFSIGSPIWLVNAFLMSHFNYVDLAAAGGVHLGAIMGAVVSIPIIYIPIIIGFYFDISGEWGIGSIMGLQLIMFLGLVYDDIVLKRHEKKNSKNKDLVGV
ncbi:hypothetical protein KI659_18095 [Litoribacter alkaliphilus]|uniref:Uncharacterized protein n=1 Tax=Litoribacter ruber TaxID=702568 RepID=A0AAP2G6P8_9BACT|nr:hypothetical protein [Litoribacter alkaliphilus]MBS9525938.1 hypothetical protein [Litoribacter alkaliphilus]